MNRRTRDVESRRQIEDLNRYRKQNNDLMKEAENSIQASRKLEQSLTQLGAILARGRREQKYSKIQENLKDLRNDTKSFNNIIKECCIEPGQRFEILHKNMEKSIAQREKVEIQYREKELRMNKVNQRYSQSMKPQDMAKVAEAQAEFDHYDKERARIKGSLDKELPELIKLLPIALSGARDVVVAAEQHHRVKSQSCMKNLGSLTGGNPKLDQNLEDQKKLLSKIKKLKICSTYQQ